MGINKRYENRLSALPEGVPDSEGVPGNILNIFDQK